MQKTGRPTKAPEQKRTRRLVMWLSKAEEEEVRAAADDTVSMNQWLIDTALAAARRERQLSFRRLGDVVEYTCARCGPFWLPMEAPGASRCPQCGKTAVEPAGRWATLAQAWPEPENTR